MSKVIIRVMKPEDYVLLYKLWSSVRGLGLRSVDDSEENIVKFIKRNPTTSFVAQMDRELIGSLMCGHDGRRACFYHVCVAERFRKQRIATRMVDKALEALKYEGINKVNLMAFKENETGNKFWHDLGWNVRDDVNLYEFNLNENNITTFVK